MFRIIEEFLENPSHKQLIKYSAALSGLCGVFLAIPISTISTAQTALASIQLFWLVLLTLALTSLIIRFVTFVWKKDKIFSSSYDIPKGILTFFVGTILVGVIVNLWAYMLSVYSGTVAVFIVNIGFPALVMLGVIWLEIFIKKREVKIPIIIQMIVDSISMGILVGLAGFYIQERITKFFYLYWFKEVSPIVAVAFFLLLVGITMYRKINIFKPHVPLQR